METQEMLKVSIVLPPDGNERQDIANSTKFIFQVWDP